MKYATKIYEFFCGNQKQLFLIPLYQRAYAWEEKHCKRLFDDIVKIHKNHLPNHFFGSIVSVQEGQLEDDLLIIDGQQRITTISIIMLALRNAVINKDIPSDITEEEVIEKTDFYLIAKFRKIDRKIKLRPIERDLRAYDALFTNTPKQFVEGCGITNNYEFFYSQIKNCGLSFDDIFDALEKLIVIDLRLEASDNPQLIFESLNSTGKDLTEADKVRNYLLMSLTKEQQDTYYTKYWRNIEICTNDDPTMYIRDFLTINLRRICNIENLYFDFKEYDSLYKLDREDLFKTLLHYAEYYKQISRGETEDTNVNKKLKQLASIGSFVAMPFYLSFFDFAYKNGFGFEAIYNVLDITENFWARRIMCGYPANALNKLYATLHNDVMRIYSAHEKREKPLDYSQYAEVLKFILLRKQGNAKFPTDLELEDAFKTRMVYKLPIEYRYFLFERMENENNKEGIKPIVDGMKNDLITIEHIMPQTLTSQWKHDLGEQYEAIYEKYLHTFANLTLTAYNSNYSNRPFEEKLNGYVDKNGDHVPGFKESHFSISDYVKTCATWTEKELVEREQMLLNRFKKLWHMITTTYEPLEKETEVVSFADDEYELTGRKLLAFSFKGQKHDVTTWKDMLVQVCQMVYSEDKYKVDYLCQKEEWFHTKDTADHSRTRIGDNCYVYTSCSTKSKQSILSYLFSKCDISEDALELYLQPISDKQVDDNEE